MDAFLDGDDLCAGCGACCTDVRNLKLTTAEIGRLPSFAPLVTGSDGTFSLASWSGPCPYLLPDRRCGVFDRRPADCGAYPIDVGHIGVRQPDGSVTVRYRFEAGDCPERVEFTRLAQHGDKAPLRQWLAEASGESDVRLEQDPRQRWRTRLLLALHAVGLANPLLSVTGRRATRPGPAGTDREG